MINDELVSSDSKQWVGADVAHAAAAVQVHIHTQVDALA